MNQAYCIQGGHIKWTTDTKMEETNSESYSEDDIERDWQTA